MWIWPRNIFTLLTWFVTRFLQKLNDLVYAVWYQIKMRFNFVAFYQILTSLKNLSDCVVLSLNIWLLFYEYLPVDFDKYLSTTITTGYVIRSLCFEVWWVLVNPFNFIMILIIACKPLLCVVIYCWLYWCHNYSLIHIHKMRSFKIA